MMKHIRGAIRRAAALAASVLLLAAQLALPAAALAQDLTALPTVTLQWTDQDGAVHTVPVTPSLYGEQPVYWATVEEAALQFGVTVQSIMGVEDPAVVTYAPAPGTPVTGNATAVDGMVSLSVEVYREGNFEAAYPLYLSVIPMPPYVPETPEALPSFVTVHHVDEKTGTQIAGDTTADLMPNEEGYYASAYQIEAAGYSYSYASMEHFTADGMGTPIDVTLYYVSDEPAAPDPVSSTVTVHHVADGVQIAGDTTVDLMPNEEGYYASAYQIEAPGYSYSYASMEHFTVDGMGTPIDITLYYVSDEPAAPDPVSSMVTVHHVDEKTGVQIAGDTTADLMPNGEGYYASAYQIEAPGYSYSYASMEHFTVDGMGTPIDITLYYVSDEPDTPDPIASAVTVHHVADGVQIAGDTTVDLTPNSDGYNAADYQTVVEGYTFVGAEPSVIMVDGAGTPVTVTLTYEKQQTEPEPEPEPEDPVVLEEYANQYGITTKGKLNLRSEPTAKKQNAVAKGVAKDVVLPAYQKVQGMDDDGLNWYKINYEGQDCYVREDCFRLLSEEEMQQQLSVEVPVRYVDQATGEAFYTTTARCMKGGSVTVEADLSQTQGYTLQSEASVLVSADEKGALTPAEALFTFAKADVQPVLGKIYVTYVDGDQNPVEEPQTFEREPGTYAVTDFAIHTPEGYTPDMVNVQEVIVHEDGTVEPETVIFRYRVNAPETVASTVTVHHVAEGAQIAGDTTVDLMPNESGYNASEQQLAIDGYTYAGASPETFYVDGVGTPVEVTLTYTKNAPELVASTVTVHHVAEGVQIAGDTTADLMPNESGYNASEQQLAIDGYTYAGASPETFYVDGVGTPVEVTLTYTKNAPELVASTVTVHHVAEGVQIAGDTTADLMPNESGYNASEQQLAIDGYTYAGASPETFYVDGVGTPVEVTLTYTKNAPELVASTVTFRHVDADGKTIADDRSIELAPSAEEYASEKYATAAPDGYLYAGANPTSFTVDGSGTPVTVVFTYALKPAMTASVTFEYVSESGRVVADPMTVQLPVGTTDVMEYKAVQDGYTFKSVSSQTVEVSADGKATPAKVTFTYTENPTTAQVQVHYRNAIGDDLPGSPVILQLGPGTHTVQPDASQVASGYALSANAAPQTVVVTQDLVATPNSISFTCYDAAITGTVTVNYYDVTASNKLITSEQRQLKPGTQTVQPDDTVVARVGNYQRAEGSAVQQQVMVTEAGAVIPAAVSFYYKPAENTDYVGYLLVTRQTAMRQTASANGTVVQTLPVNTVLWAAGQHQAGTVTWHSANTVVGSSVAGGFVNDADVRRISDTEAHALIEEQNQQNQQPTQTPGYYITLYDSVPLRAYTNVYAEARYLKKNTVVYVHGQEYDGSRNLWHLTTYSGVTGYVLNGQLRKLTDAETQQYLSQGNPSQPTNPGGNPYDPNGMSSYGYVTSSGVNFRSTPGGSRIKQLNKYAMAMVIGTREVDGVTWYNVNYNGQIGWLHGDYFHQMTLTEFNSFVGSQQYQQGITNNAVQTAKPTVTAKPGSGSSSGGSATQGNVSSVEDWNVGSWQNTGTGSQSTYAPFNPYATPAVTAQAQGQYVTKDGTVKLYNGTDAASGGTTLPANATFKVIGTVDKNNKKWYQVEYDGKTGYIEADAAIAEAAPGASPTPTSTVPIGTMIPIDYEDETRETQTSSVPWGLIGGAVVVIGGAGGAYAYALNQNKKRKAAAARAAANRRAGAAAGSTAAGAASPYARRAAAAPTAPNAQGAQGASANAQQGGRPGTAAGTPPYGGVKNPYSSGSITGASSAKNPYSRPVGTPGAAGTTPASPYGATSGTPGTAASAAGANPYAGGASGSGANPYAAGMIGAAGVKTQPHTAEKPIPYADGTLPGADAPAGRATNASVPGAGMHSAGDLASGKTNAPATGNPYARPLSAAPEAPAPAPQEQSAETASRRRATRMQRYHAAGGDGEENE